MSGASYLYGGHANVLALLIVILCLCLPASLWAAFSGWDLSA